MKYLKRFNENTSDIIDTVNDVSYELNDDGFDLEVSSFERYIICRLLPNLKDEINESLIENTLRIIELMYQNSYDLGSNKWLSDTEGRLRIKRKVGSAYYVITPEELNEFIGIDFEIIELVFVPII
jgi:hypothetical protein